MIELENGELEKIDKFLERFVKGREFIREFLNKPEITTLLDNNKFDELYYSFRSSTSYLATLLTRVLLFSGIDFLDYMTYVPEYCFKGIKIKSITLPSSIKEIMWDAFVDTDLETLKYAGTMKEWEEVKIQNKLNMPVYEVLCKDGVVKL